jgi:hypothetical protein
MQSHRTLLGVAVARESNLLLQENIRNATLPNATRITLNAFRISARDSVTDRLWSMRELLEVTSTSQKEAA